MPDRIHAPELAGALEWFNVPEPLTLARVRGKVVLLDFWTYGCVNCMHVLPDLKRLEQKYGDALVVIGVHSAKFANEKDNDNIRRIIVRYDIDHPVANDAEFRIWRAYGARAWPTQVLIDPEGYVVATASGEGKGEAFDQAIAAVIHVFEEQGKIDRTPLKKSLERERIETATLAFPGKVVADAARGRLVIADSNHHRVVIADLDGRVYDTIGGPSAGRVDGVFEGARFYRPQGLAVDGETVFIADTENHTLRAADLGARRVTTIAGTGKQAGWGADGGAALDMSLNSPWDLAVRGRLLFVAMAGSHQIWIVDRDHGISIAYAGSGREARIDGAVDEAAFAQPSGISIAGETMFVADAESNIIRTIALPPKNDVRTLAGGDLFEFGDKDGFGDAVRLQHPLGVAAAPDGRVFIADTYNHKIKVLDARDRKVTTFAGSGQAGHSDGAATSARFYEPGGLSIGGEWIYVADTNNHAIRRVRLTDGVVETVNVRVS
jgi:thiol-disulfide isomerase/thioredoxin